MRLHSPQSAVVFRGHLQHARHHRPHSVGASRRNSGGRRGCDLATQRLHLCSWRHYCALHLHQADRPDPYRTEGLLMITQIRRSVVFALFCLVFFGLLYPLVGTGVSQVLFKHQANGSITANGSTLVGQNWTSPKFFHGRPERLRAVCRDRGQPARRQRQERRHRRNQPLHPGPRCCSKTPRRSSPTGTRWA